jgi:hypothetical protein
MILTAPPIDLHPGDVLLYSPSDLAGRLIAFKTWHRISHIETYIGEGKSIASRFPSGVGTYPVRLTNLVSIYRPTWTWDRENVLRWQAAHDGERYDWQTLFTFLGIQEADPYDPGMICSEHAAWAALASGGRPFGNEPCHQIAPFQFGTTDDYVQQWAA